MPSKRHSMCTSATQLAFDSRWSWVRWAAISVSPHRSRLGERRVRQQHRCDAHQGALPADATPHSNQGRPDSQFTLKLPDGTADAVDLPPTENLSQARGVEPTVDQHLLDCPECHLRIVGRQPHRFDSQHSDSASSPISTRGNTTPPFRRIDRLRGCCPVRPRRPSPRSMPSTLSARSMPDGSGGGSDSKRRSHCTFSRPESASARACAQDVSVTCAGRRPASAFESFG